MNHTSWNYHHRSLRMMAAMILVRWMGGSHRYGGRGGGILVRSFSLSTETTIHRRHGNCLLSSPTTTRLFSSSSLERDRQGRNIRRRSEDDDWWGGGNEQKKESEDSAWSGSSGGRADSSGSRRGGTSRNSASSGRRDDRSRMRSPSSISRNSMKNSYNDDDDDDDDDGWDPEYTPKPRAIREREGRSTPFRSSSQGGGNGGRGGGGGGGGGGGSQWSRQSRGGGRDFGIRRSGGAGGNGAGGGARGNQRSTDRNEETKGRAINMNALEAAGFVHLYGLSSVLNALEANRRDFSADQEHFQVTSSSSSEHEDDDDNEVAEGRQRRGGEPPKPSAQFRSYLFVQERSSSTRRGQKATDAERVLTLAEERGVAVAEVDKGILNTLSGNRPHQGFVLRCGKLYFESLSRVPVPGEGVETPSLWLVLDEVVDPQNLGALLRSAYFLGGRKIGVLVCAKNSAPPTPVVSASSAGALEVVTVHSTTNLPRTLNQAREDGFRIIGASSSVPSISSSSSSEGDDEFGSTPPPLYDLSMLPVQKSDDRPILLVLGSEGYGLRTLVAKACTEFVRIPSGSNDSSDDGGVDSLNVSVTGGILLWHLLNGQS